MKITTELLIAAIALSLVLIAISYHPCEQPDGTLAQTCDVNP